MFIVWPALRAGDTDPFFPLGMLVFMLHKSMSCFCFKYMKIGKIFSCRDIAKHLKGAVVTAKKQRFS